MIFSLSPNRLQNNSLFQQIRICDNAVNIGCLCFEVLSLKMRTRRPKILNPQGWMSEIPTVNPGSDADVLACRAPSAAHRGRALGKRKPRDCSCSPAVEARSCARGSAAERTHPPSWTWATLLRRAETAGSAYRQRRCSRCFLCWVNISLLTYDILTCYRPWHVTGLELYNI